MEAYFEIDNHGINKPQNVGQDGINGPPKRRRIMTDRRREQNRQAQKNHRKYGIFLVTQQYMTFDNCVGEKQKRRLQELASAEVQSKSSGTSNLSSDTGQNVSKSLFDNNDWIDIVNDSEGFDSAWRDLGTNEHSIHSNSEASLSKVFPLNSAIADESNLLQSGVVSQSWDIPSEEPQSGIWPADANPQRDPPSVPQSLLNRESVCLPWPSLDIPQGLPEAVLMPELQADTDSQVIAEGFTFPEGPSTVPGRTDRDPLANEPKDDNINQMIAQNRISMEDIIFAGLEAITHKFRDTSKSTNPLNSYTHAENRFSPQSLNSINSTFYAPSPSITHVPMRRTALMAACLANAAHIGIDVYKHIRRPGGDSPSPSPFFQPGGANATLSSLYQFIKPDLRPCLAQIKQPHNLYIDLFPFPSFRQRVLALKACTVEGEESGSEQVFDEVEFCRDLDADGIVCWGSDAEIGTGAPWDRRSWECQPWFLRKWWMVTGGPEGEMGKQSRWWAEMRGEVFEEM
jgi:hypothetical protein